MESCFTFVTNLGAFRDFWVYWYLCLTFPAVTIVSGEFASHSLVAFLKTRDIPEQETSSLLIKVSTKHLTQYCRKTTQRQHKCDTQTQTHTTLAHPGQGMLFFKFVLSKFHCQLMKHNFSLKIQRASLQSRH